MREPARDKGRLENMAEAAAFVRQFTEGIEFATFVEDPLRYFAILKNVEIFGEAAYMLTPEFKQKHPEIPWAQIVGMRHVLVHDYSTVMPKILWHTATVEIPELMPLLEGLIQSME